jgi:hypothetical protein
VNSTSDKRDLRDEVDQGIASFVHPWQRTET